MFAAQIPMTIFLFFCARVGAKRSIGGWTITIFVIRGRLWGSVFVTMYRNSSWCHTPTCSIAATLSLGTVLLQCRCGKKGHNLEVARNAIVGIHNVNWVLKDGFACLACFAWRLSTVFHNCIACLLFYTGFCFCFGNWLPLHRFNAHWVLRHLRGLLCLLLVVEIVLP